jgi:hypothetical protein
MKESGMFLSLRVAAVAAGIALALCGPASAKTCKQGICVSGSDTARNGGLFVQVTITHTLKGVPITHYNIRRNGGQDASQGSYAFVAKPGFKQYYSVQACTGGGFLKQSSCGPWVRFYHMTAR